MQILFTPWRFAYLTAPKTESSSPCIFCTAAIHEDTRQTLTLYRNERALVMLNRYPYTNGHLMVAPVAHEARLFDSSERSLRSLIRLTAESQRNVVTILPKMVHEEQTAMVLPWDPFYRNFVGESAPEHLEYSARLRALPPRMIAKR